MYRRLVLAALLALACQAADVTIRRSVNVTLGSALPPEIQTPLKEQIASSTPPENVVRIKGDKAYASAGQLVVITDTARDQVTLLNPKTKQYSTGSLADYVDHVVAATQAATKNFAAPQAQQIILGMKFDVQTRKTGQTATIHGILAEETVISLSMNLPTGENVLPAVRMEVDCWFAQPGEVARVAGLKEFAGYTARTKGAFDPSEALSKMFAQMPGLGDQLREPLKNLNANGTLMLKMRARVFVPTLAQAMPEIDPNTPLAEIQSDLTELSTAPIADSVFAVPADYKSAPMEDLLKLALPTPQQSKK